VTSHEPVPTDPKDKRVQYTRMPVVDALDTDAFRFVFELWRARRRGRPLPARGDFDPLDLKPVLARLMLIEVQDDPPDFRYRLAGTHSRDLTGQEWTGRSIRELVPQQHARLLWNDLCEMQQTLQPQYVRLDIISAVGEPLSYRVLRLPLGSDGKRMDMAMVVQDYGDTLPLLRKYFDDERQRQP